MVRQMSLYMSIWTKQKEVGVWDLRGKECISQRVYQHCSPPPGFPSPGRPDSLSHTSKGQQVCFSCLVSSVMFHRHTVSPGFNTWHLHRFAVVHPHFNPWQVSAGLISALPCPFTGFSRRVLEPSCVDLINAEAASLAFQPLYNQVSFQLVSTSSLFLNRRPPNPSRIGDGGGPEIWLWEQSCENFILPDIPAPNTVSPFRIPAFPTRSGIKGH